MHRRMIQTDKVQVVTSPVGEGRIVKENVGNNVSSPKDFLNGFEHGGERLEFEGGSDSPP